MKLTKIFFLSLGLCLASAHAATTDSSKGVTFSGSFEGGYNYTWKSTPSSADSNWSVDYLNLNATANVSETTKLVLNNGFAMASNVQSVFGGFQPTSNFWVRKLNNGGFTLGNTAAYIDHKCMDKMHTWVGNFGVPYGMESMVDRFDLPTYYYSGGYTVWTSRFGLQDLGVKFAFLDLGPGNLEVAVQEGSVSQQTGFGPMTTARYAMDVKSGDMAITPTASLLLNRWRGGPKDLGVTLGTGFKMGALTAAAELLYTAYAQDVMQDPKVKITSAYLEPGFDLGFLMASAKLEYLSVKVGDADAVTDYNVGAAISHTYAGGYRVRLAYQHAGLNGNFGPGGQSHVNDIRLFVGTKF